MKRPIVTVHRDNSIQNLETRGRVIWEDAQTIKTDRKEAKTYRLALAKEENNQPLSEAEKSSKYLIRYNYPEFFQDEGPESDPEEKTSPQYKEIKQVGRVMEDLTNELNLHKIKIVQIKGT